jgi:hypothetical protein
MRELLRAVIWHFEDYAWLYFLAVAFACLFLSPWLARRRRRNTLRGLFGSAFVEGGSFVSVGGGIAVDDTSKRFAIVRGGKNAICSPDEIT